MKLEAEGRPSVASVALLSNVEAIGNLGARRARARESRDGRHMMGGSRRCPSQAAVPQALYRPELLALDLGLDLDFEDLENSFSAISNSAIRRLSQGPYTSPRHS